MNTLTAYSDEDFDLQTAVTDRKIPLPHRKVIRRELEKIRLFNYDHLVPSHHKAMKPLKPLYDGTMLYELRPRCPGRTPYRLPLVSPSRPNFLILGFFQRKDADFNKEIVVAENRYRRIKTNQATYELIDLDQISL